MITLLPSTITELSLPDHIHNALDAVRFYTIIKASGISYHPDDDARFYVFWETEVPAFSEDLARRINDLRDDGFRNMGDAFYGECLAVNVG